MQSSFFKFPCNFSTKFECSIRKMNHLTWSFSCGRQIRYSPLILYIALNFRTHALNRWNANSRSCRQTISIGAAIIISLHMSTKSFSPMPLWLIIIRSSQYPKLFPLYPFRVQWQATRRALRWCPYSLASFIFQKNASNTTRHSFNYFCGNILLDIPLKLYGNNTAKRQWPWSTYFNAFAFELNANDLKKTQTSWRLV